MRVAVDIGTHDYHCYYMADIGVGFVVGTVCCSVDNWSYLPGAARGCTLTNRTKKEFK